MRIPRNNPIGIYVLCVLLALAFWFVFASTKMDDVTKTVYFLFLPLTSCPFMMWVIHKEGNEPPEYFKDAYGGNLGLMWFVRMFMMVVISALGSVAAILIFGVIALIARLF